MTTLLLTLIGDHSKLCQAYAQLGARGTTLLFDAGDGGADCAVDGSDRFGPTFPSDCPLYVLVPGFPNPLCHETRLIPVSQRNIRRWDAELLS